MVIMYLMKRFELDLEMALTISKSRREIVDPNEGFMQKLKEFEDQLFEHPTDQTYAVSTKILPSVRFSDSSSSSEDLMERRRSVDI